MLVFSTDVVSHNVCKSLQTHKLIVTWHTGEISGLAALCNFGYFGGFRDLSNNEYVFWVGVAACAGRIQRTVMEQVCNSSLYLSVRITSNLLIIKITSVALENT